MNIFPHGHTHFPHISMKSQFAKLTSLSISRYQHHFSTKSHNMSNVHKLWNSSHIRKLLEIVNISIWNDIKFASTAQCAKSNDLVRLMWYDQDLSWQKWRKLQPNHFHQFWFYCCCWKIWMLIFPLSVILYNICTKLLACISYMKKKCKPLIYQTNTNHNWLHTFLSIIFEKPCFVTSYDNKSTKQHSFFLLNITFFFIQTAIFVDCSHWYNTAKTETRIWFTFLFLLCVLVFVHRILAISKSSFEQQYMFASVISD